MTTKLLLAAVPALMTMTPAVGVDASRAPRAHPCAARMPVQRAGRGVHVRRRGADVRRPRYLQLGDHVRMPRTHRLFVRSRGNRYSLRGVRADVRCARVLVTRAGPRRRLLVIRLTAGVVRMDRRARAAAIVLTPEAAVIARTRGRTYVRRVAARRRTQVRPKRRKVELADVRRQRLRVNVRPPAKGLIDRAGPRLNTYPFALSPQQRRPRRGDGLVAFWRDGRSCSVGCHARGARRGWPLRPFHRQHALRAGLNELRPANFHVGIDIQARDHQAVYPMSSGRVHVIQRRGPDERVQVGHFVYWHINHRVHEGQHVRAYRTRLGVVKRYYHHLHLSELVGGRYLNPLRPGGRNLRPWSDSEPPVIGRPYLHRGGRVTVAAFDPQSFVVGIRNVTPVLAPAAIAWRLFDARGRRVTRLEWALRGSQHLPDRLRRVVYTPSARNPGFRCFTHHFVCIPRWRYRLAGGLTPPLPRSSLRRGRYRLAVYAWDWAGNLSARDLWFRVLGRAAKEQAPKRFAPLHPRADVE